VGGRVLLALLALVAFARVAAAGGPEPVLALTSRPGSGSRLVALDPATLAPAGKGLTLPGWAFGVEWVRSPGR
jgi:hypothetical protein